MILKLTQFNQNSTVYINIVVRVFGQMVVFVLIRPETETTKRLSNLFNFPISTSQGSTSPFLNISNVISNVIVHESFQTMSVVFTISINLRRLDITFILLSTMYCVFL